MKVLFIGSLKPGQTSFDRMNALKGCDVDTIPFNTLSHIRSKSRVLNSIAARFNIGPKVWNCNKNLLKTASSLSDLTHIWVEKGTWLWPKTLERIRELTKAKAIHYTPDTAFWWFNKSRHFSRGVSQYDLLFTTKKFELNNYEKAGARRVVLTEQSFDENRFYPQPETPAYKSDVTFIGHHEQHYADMMLAVTQATNEVCIWGNKWKENTKKHLALQRAIKGNGLWAEKYPRALCSAKISIGLLSKWFPEKVTTRSFEIPACGTMLLAERTEEHRALFEEGKEAEFFSTKEELKHKIAYYLSHEDERIKLALAGLARCRVSGYSTQERMKQMLINIQRL